MDKITKSVFAAILVLFFSGCSVPGPAPSALPVSSPASTPNKIFLPEINSGGSVTPAPTGASNPVFPTATGGGQPGQETAYPSKVSLAADKTTLKVGETVTLTVTLTGIGLPYYELLAQDPGNRTPASLGRVTYENQTTVLSGGSRILSFLSAKGSMNQATFILRATDAGPTELWVTVTGEVKVAEGAFVMGGGGSNRVVITASR